MDNLSAHKAAMIEPWITQAGAQLIYLSPYSPDFNPIENCWSKFKAYLRAVAARCRDTVETALVDAIDSLTLKDIENWFTHCCYCTTSWYCDRLNPLSTAANSVKVGHGGWVGRTIAKFSASISCWRSQRS